MIITSENAGAEELRTILSIDAPCYSFSSNLNEIIPNTGSIIYTIWSLDDEFLYVGIAGLQKDPTKRSPLSRMKSHASGVRSGDQFCVYIQDFYVIPEIVKAGRYAPEKGLLDRLTKEYIHKNMRFRFAHFVSEDSDKVVRALEKQIQKGACGSVKPSINPQ